MRQLREQGMKTILVGGDALVTDEYWQITGDAGAGTLMTFSPDPRKSAAAAEVVKRFQAKNINPEGYTLYTYAAIQAWAQAATAAKREDSKAVIAELNKSTFKTVIGDFTFDKSPITFKTVIGDFTFDKKGDPSLPPYTIYEWNAGKYAQLD